MCVGKERGADLLCRTSLKANGFREHPASV